jgi:hypothetical protein
MHCKMSPFASQVLDVPCTIQKRGGSNSSGASVADRRTLVTVKISSTKSNAGPAHAPAARPHASMTDSPAGRSLNSASSGMPTLSLASSASILDDADLDLYSKTAITVFVVRYTYFLYLQCYCTIALCPVIDCSRVRAK